MSQIEWKKRNWTRMCNSVDGRWRITEAGGMFILFDNKVPRMPPVYALVTAKAFAQGIVDTEERRQEMTPVLATRKVFHVVMEHATVTFLSYDAMVDFLGPRSINSIESDTILCESDVTTQEWDRLDKWHRANGQDSSAAHTSAKVDQALDKVFDSEEPK